MLHYESCNHNISSQVQYSYPYFENLDQKKYHMDYSLYLYVILVFGLKLMTIPLLSILLQVQVLILVGFHLKKMNLQNEFAKGKEFSKVNIVEFCIGFA